MRASQSKLPLRYTDFQTNARLNKSFANRSFASKGIAKEGLVEYPGLVLRAIDHRQLSCFVPVLGENRTPFFFAAFASYIAVSAQLWLLRRRAYGGK